LLAIFWPQTPKSLAYRRFALTRVRRLFVVKAKSPSGAATRGFLIESMMIPVFSLAAPAI
jgi:hypothetical protein